MDQVPLPFVVGQDCTFGGEEDKYVNIKFPKEAPSKLNFTMHVVTNAGSGANKHGWVDLVCRGKGKKIRVDENKLWHKDVDMF